MASITFEVMVRSCCRSYAISLERGALTFDESSLGLRVIEGTLLGYVVLALAFGSGARLLLTDDTAIDLRH